MVSKNLGKLAKEHSDASFTEKKLLDRQAVIMVREGGKTKEYLIDRKEYEALQKIESLRIDEQKHASGDFPLPEDFDYIFSVSVRDGKIVSYNFSQRETPGTKALQKIPNEIGDLTFLESIWISFNEIDSLEPLSRNERLTEIFANVNNISDLSPLGSLQLKTLVISRNPIESLEPLYSVNTLVSLDVESTKIRCIDGIQRLANLENLNVGGLGISEMPDSISSMKRLKTLYISGNRFSKLPEAISKMDSLETLNANNCGLSNIDGIGGMKSLKNLNVGYNRLESLPDEIGCLQHCEIFNVTKNELKTLPKSIIKLKKLNILDASYNEIAHLPRLYEFSPQFLHLNNNHIKCFSKPFRGLKAGYVLAYGNDETWSEQKKTKKLKDSYVAFSGPEMY